MPGSDVGRRFSYGSSYPLPRGAPNGLLCESTCKVPSLTQWYTPYGAAVMVQIALVAAGTQLLYWTYCGWYAFLPFHLDCRGREVPPMNQTQTLFEFPLPGPRAVGWLTGRLTCARLSVLRSFDLASARTAAAVGCPCPHHGTSACDCELTVLLVYADGDAGPLTLIIHGYDNTSWLEVPCSLDAEQKRLLGRVLAALGVDIAL